MSFLIDTNVISEVRRQNGSAIVKRWFASVAEAELFLSVLVVGEIRLGVERLRRRDAAQAATFDAWLAALETDYADRILPVTVEVAQEWGRLNVPDPLSVIDGLLAATAKIHGLTWVTRNTADFSRTRVMLLDPFTA